VEEEEEEGGKLPKRRERGALSLSLLFSPFSFSMALSPVAEGEPTDLQIGQ